MGEEKRSEENGIAEAPGSKVSETRDIVEVWFRDWLSSEFWLTKEKLQHQENRKLVGALILQCLDGIHSGGGKKRSRQKNNRQLVDDESENEDESKDVSHRRSSRSVAELTKVKNLVLNMNDKMPKSNLPNKQVATLISDAANKIKLAKKGKNVSAKNQSSSVCDTSNKVLKRDNQTPLDKTGTKRRNENLNEGQVAKVARKDVSLSKSKEKRSKVMMTDEPEESSAKRSQRSVGARTRELYSPTLQNVLELSCKEQNLKDMKKGHHDGIIGDTITDSKVPMMTKQKKENTKTGAIGRGRSRSSRRESTKPLSDLSEDDNERTPNDLPTKTPARKDFKQKKGLDRNKSKSGKQEASSINAQSKGKNDTLSNKNAVKDANSEEETISKGKKNTKRTLAKYSKKDSNLLSNKLEIESKSKGFKSKKLSKMTISTKEKKSRKAPRRGAAVLAAAMLNTEGDGQIDDEDDQTEEYMIPYSPAVKKNNNNKAKISDISSTPCAVKKTPTKADAKKVIPLKRSSMVTPTKHSINHNSNSKEKKEKATNVDGKTGSKKEEKGDLDEGKELNSNSKKPLKMTKIKSKTMDSTKEKSETKGSKDGPKNDVNSKSNKLPKRGAAVIAGVKNISMKADEEEHAESSVVVGNVGSEGSAGKINSDKNENNAVSTSNKATKQPKKTGAKTVVPLKRNNDKISLAKPLKSKPIKDDIKEIKHVNTTNGPDTVVKEKKEKVTSSIEKKKTVKKNKSEHKNTPQKKDIHVTSKISTKIVKTKAAEQSTESVDMKLPTLSQEPKATKSKGQKLSKKDTKEGKESNPSDTMAKVKDVKSKGGAKVKSDSAIKDNVTSETRTKNSKNQDKKINKKQAINCDNIEAKDRSINDTKKSDSINAPSNKKGTNKNIAQSKDNVNKDDSIKVSKNKVSKINTGQSKVNAIKDDSIKVSKNEVSSKLKDIKSKQVNSDNKKEKKQPDSRKKKEKKSSLPPNDSINGSIARRTSSDEENEKVLSDIANRYGFNDNVSSEKISKNFLADIAKNIATTKITKRKRDKSVNMPLTNGIDSQKSKKSKKSKDSLSKSDIKVTKN